MYDDGIDHDLLLLLVVPPCLLLLLFFAVSRLWFSSVSLSSASSPRSWALELQACLEAGVVYVL